MAEETEKSTVATEGDVPEAFGKAMDEIEKPAPSEDDAQPVSEEEPVETPAGEEEPEVSVEAESLEDIDPEVLECCRDYGWDDEKIAQIKELSPELFDDIRAVLDEEGELPAEKETKEEPKKEDIKQELEELKFDLDPDVVGQDVKGAFDKMASVLNEQRKGFADERTKLQTEIDSAFNSRIDGHLDRMAKQTPDLGSSQKLTRKQYQLRAELFAHANVTATLRKVPIERALEIEVNNYRNRGGEKAAEKRVLGKLEKNKRRFTNKPTRKAGEVGRKFKDDFEAAEYRMEQAEQKAGYG